ncbi:MAG TPA: A/G-specific adenine glycosylase [Candidatus Krumholzibacteria bacterium]|nr:A/G-specific adenine glycosylase [Candidatus Krumholzibacteria bacterium]HPD71217.1 A/G-specific adenine glycosylase [Candidatus Krumholzibacteria bacterium]HRY39083.1 A/G-specific adenine glycosylase [Candidatus Krumholzibacteria bacterium]
MSTDTTSSRGRGESGRAAVAARQRALLDWYDREGRDLPWRRGPSLYGTWLAEIMLQQTTVAAVIPRWVEFRARFPDVATLAAAPEADVLAAWSGLGYYRRARLLHRAARKLAAAGGDLPRTLVDWRAVPGVGEYAAGAIASIGLGLAVPAIDANVRRVLTRWICPDDAATRQFTPARLRGVALAHVTPARPGDWNQAVMDLGAGPCRAGEAACDRCPVLRWCAAGRAGATALVPAPPVRPQSVRVVLGALVLRRDGRVLQLPSESAVVARARGHGQPLRTSLAGLFEGMVSLPLTNWYRDREAGDSGVIAGWRAWLRTLGWTLPVVRPVGHYRHAITVHRLRVEVAVADWPGSLDPPGLPDERWAHPSASAPLAGIARRAMSLAAASAAPE